MRHSIRHLVLVVVMAALIAALLPLPVALAATPAPATSFPARQFEQPIVIVNTGFLHLRSGPGGFYAVIGTLPGGAVLPTVGRNRDDSWWQVQSIFGVGWVSAEYVIPRGDFTLIPIVNDLGLLEQARGLVVGSPVNVYTYPDRGAYLLGLALAGSELPISGRTADAVWWQVRTNVGSGWVLQQDVALRGSASVVPVVAIPVAAVQPVVLLPPSAAAGLQDGQGGAEPATTTATTTTTGGTAGTVRQVAVVLDGGAEVKERPDINSGTIDYLEANQQYNITRLSPRGDFALINYRESFSDRSGWVSLASVGVVTLNDPRLQAIYTGPNVLIDLKAQPDENSETVAVAPRGAQLAVNQSLPGGVWLQVQYGTDVGWVTGISVIVVGAGPATTTTTTTTAQVVGSPASGLYSGGIALLPIPVPEPERNYVIVNTSFLNIRSGPGANYTTLQTVSGATEFDVTGITPDSVWFRVVGPFGAGWVNSEFVIFRGIIGEVPVVEYGEATGLTTVSLPQALAVSPVNVYLGPGVNTGLLGTASAGASLPVVGRTSDWVWLQVQTQVGFGWVLYSTITFRGDAAVVPIVG